MLLQQVGHLPLGFSDFIKRLGGVDNGGIQHTAGGIHHRQLAAVAIAGVPAQHHLTGEGRLHQQVVQIFGKDPDGLLAGILEQLPEGFIFHAGGNEALPAIGGSFHHGAAAGIIGDHRFAADGLQGFFLLQHNGSLKEALLFAAVDGQHPVRGDAAHRLLEVVIHLIGGVLGAIAGGGNHGRPVDQKAQCLADLAVIGNILRDDIHSAGESILGGLHALFRVHILRSHAKRLPQGILHPDGRRQRFQALFPGNAAAGAALGLIGTVEVLHLRQSGRSLNGGLQLRGKLFLLGDGANDLLPAFLQVAQVFQPVAEVTQGGIIQAVGHLLAIAGNEGDGVAFIQKAHGGFHLCWAEL